MSFALALADVETAWRSGFDLDMVYSVKLINATQPWLEKSKAASIP
ncbi:MAG: hypothetical protein ABJL72_09500 [Roseobacter sp.]